MRLLILIYMAFLMGCFAASEVEKSEFIKVNFKLENENTSGLPIEIKVLSQEKVSSLFLDVEAINVDTILKCNTPYTFNIGNGRVERQIDRFISRNCKDTAYSFSVKPLEVITH